jgi:hypothetical protein
VRRTGFPFVARTPGATRSALNSCAGVPTATHPTGTTSPEATVVMTITNRRMLLAPDRWGHPLIERLVNTTLML